MTAPREILAGATYLVTRRCSQRQFLLKPSPLTNQLVRYCLADAARHTGVEIHALCVMSNHWHGVVTDPNARLPEFLERFHRLLARVQNAALGRWENLWSSDKPSVVRLISDDDVLDKMAYVITNPTAAGLVQRPEQWPGILAHRIGERTVVDKPEIFFRREGALAAKLSLVMTRAPIYKHLDDASFALQLARAVEKKVHAAHAEMRDARRSFQGVRAILRQRFDAAPRSNELRRNPNPRIAAHRTPQRIRAIRLMLDFFRRYRAARQAWRRGVRETLFPAGTYALRIQAGVTCASEAEPGATPLSPS
jgi:REP element-mobilizing transposase RayT